MKYFPVVVTEGILLAAVPGLLQVTLGAEPTDHERGAMQKKPIKIIILYTIFLYIIIISDLTKIALMLCAKLELSNQNLLGPCLEWQSLRNEKNLYCHYLMGMAT
jgi:hypothetical protein